MNDHFECPACGWSNEADQLAARQSSNLLECGCRFVPGTGPVHRDICPRRGDDTVRRADVDDRGRVPMRPVTLPCGCRFTAGSGAVHDVNCPHRYDDHPAWRRSAP